MLDQLRDFDISELAADHLGNWPEPIKWLVIGLALVLTVGGGHGLWLSGRWQALGVAVAAEQTLRESYARNALAAADLEVLSRQQARLESAFAALLRQLPSDTEVPGLLEDITRTALDSGLTIQAIDLESERQAAVYVELPIRITVEGDFHQFGSFVSGVASLSRIVTLHDFNIAPAGRRSGLRMTILARTYRYLDAGQ